MTWRTLDGFGGGGTLNEEKRLHHTTPITSILVIESLKIKRQAQIKFFNIRLTTPFGSSLTLYTSTGRALLSWYGTRRF